MDNNYRTIDLKNFDKNNEPEIRLMDDGDIYLVFNFFPPESFDMKGEDIDSFAKELSNFIGTPVLHEDREFFLIKKTDNFLSKIFFKGQNKTIETAEKIKQFVETYKERKGYLKKQHSDKKSWNKKGIIDFTISYFEDKLKLKGFKTNRKWQYLRKKTDFGFINIGVPVFEYHPQYQMDFNVGIRIDEVQKVYDTHFFVETQTDEIRNNQMSWFFMWDFFNDFDRTRVNVSSFQELEKHLGTVYEKISLEVLPLVDKIQDPVELEKFVWNLIAQKDQRTINLPEINNIGIALILTKLYNNDKLNDRIAFISTYFNENPYDPKVKNGVEKLILTFQQVT